MDNTRRQRFKGNQMEDLRLIARPLKELEEEIKKREILQEYQSNQKRDYLLYSVTIIFMIGVQKSTQ